MIIVIQRINNSEVKVDGNTVGQATKGLLVLVGIKQGDNREICLKMAEKVAKMRIFEDENNKMNLSVSDIKGQALVVPNFTLCASCRRGTRPDFIAAEKPESANHLYTQFANDLKNLGIHVQCGAFGENMQIQASLDGPVTIILDSEKDLGKI